MPPRILSDLKNLETLASSEYSRVFELLHTGIAVMSATGHFLYCNDAFRKMFNLPKDLRGKHVSDFFITGEAGVMTTIRTRKPTFCTSLTTGNEQGISFRYPLLDRNNNLQGVIIESISPSIGRERLEKLFETIQSLEKRSSYFEQRHLKKSSVLCTFDSIIGESEPMRKLKQSGIRFAHSKEPILLLGESGVGKELVAQALHTASNRNDKPFVTINCAALPHELMEAELFGYEQGAFTGAKSGGSKGKFELANTGSIFLDEIGELPLTMQAKLLRVLESGEIQKIGSSTQLHSNFRLIAATNRNLEESIRKGRFREDLYHRLNILEISIPPLRERLDDIPLLCAHFIEQHAGPKRAQEIRISGEVYRAFRESAWPGNIRELKNVLSYALFNLEDDGNALQLHHLPPRFLNQLEKPVPKGGVEASMAPKPAPVRQSMDAVRQDAESKALQEALKDARYNKSVAAQMLGISRTKLYRKLRQLGLMDENGHYQEKN